MPSLYDQGRSLAQGGAVGTPRQPTHQQQNQIDAGFAHQRNQPRPQPQPSTTTKTR